MFNESEVASTRACSLSSRLPEPRSWHVNGLLGSARCRSPSSYTTPIYAKMPLGRYARITCLCEWVGADNNTRLPQSSYYDKHNRPTAALYRARQPYLIRNAVTGLCIMGFVAGVCTSQRHTLCLAKGIDEADRYPQTVGPSARSAKTTSAMFPCPTRLCRLAQL